MYILKTLLNDNNLAIEHNGYKAILLFKSMNDAIYYIRLHNILCDGIYHVENLKRFRDHLKEHNLHAAVYNSKTETMEIYNIC